MSVHTRLIKFGDDYLTDGFGSSDDQVLTRVENLHKLRLSKTGPLRIPFTGKPFEFIRDNQGSGVLLKIHANRMPTAVLDSIISTVDASKAGDTDIRVIFSDGPESITVDGRAGGDGDTEPIEYNGDFLKDNLLIDFTLNFTVSAIVP